MSVLATRFAMLPENWLWKLYRALGNPQVIYKHRCRSNEIVVGAKCSTGVTSCKQGGSGGMLP